MYSELHKTWKRELESSKLEKLPSNFYVDVAAYLRKMTEEGRMLDKRTVRAQLLKSEAENVKRMVRELARVRYEKLVKMVADAEKIAPDHLTHLEEKICEGLLPIAEAYHGAVASILRGQEPNMNVDGTQRKVVLRFLKEVPAIIGEDMKAYGPFRAEDVASLPKENSAVLVRQGFAVKIEI